jgi:hypothetical protein
VLLVSFIRQAPWCGVQIQRTSTKQVSVAVTIYACIRQVPGSNPRRPTDWHYLSLAGWMQSLPSNR